MKMLCIAIYEHRKFGRINGALLESDAKSKFEASGGVFVDSMESESPRFKNCNCSTTSQHRLVSKSRAFW